DRVPAGGRAVSAPERDELADVVLDHPPQPGGGCGCDWRPESGHHPRGSYLETSDEGSMGPYRRHLIDAILDSEAMARRDARVKAEAAAQALEKAARAMSAEKGVTFA